MWIAVAALCVAVGWKKSAGGLAGCAAACRAACSAAKPRILRQRRLLREVRCPGLGSSRHCCRPPPLGRRGLADWYVACCRRRRQTERSNASRRHNSGLECEARERASAEVSLREGCAAAAAAELQSRLCGEDRCRWGCMADAAVAATGAVQRFEAAAQESGGSPKGLVAGVTARFTVRNLLPTGLPFSAWMT